MNQSEKIKIQVVLSVVSGGASIRFSQDLGFHSILAEHYCSFNEDALSVRKLRVVFSDCGGIACGP